MPLFTTLAALSQTAASNAPDGSVDAPSTLDDQLRLLASFLAQIRDGKGFSTPVLLASSATTDIGAQNALAVEISGTTTITSFGTNYNGPRFLRFTGALTLTHNATTLNLPGGASIVTAAGDTCIAMPNSAGNGWNVVNYQTSVAASPTTVGYLSSVAGSNTVTASLANLAAYAAGQEFKFIAASSNTGATTLNINSLGAVAITKNGTSALVGGEIRAGSVVKVVYDGAQFQIVGVQNFSGAYTDVTASRAINTNYTNTTGRPLFVAASVAGAVNSSTLSVSWTVGGVSPIDQNSLIAGVPAANTLLGASAIVPPGATYQLTVTQGTLSKWHEMS